MPTTRYDDPLLIVNARTGEVLAQIPGDASITYMTAEQRHAYYEHQRQHDVPFSDAVEYYDLMDMMEDSDAPGAETSAGPEPRTPKPRKEKRRFDKRNAKRGAGFFWFACEPGKVFGANVENKRWIVYAFQLAALAGWDGLSFRPATAEKAISVMLGIDQRSSADFVKGGLASGLLVQKGDTITTDKSMFFRGVVPRSNNKLTYIKLRASAITKLYEQNKDRLVLLGRMLSLLPFSDSKTGILCQNPMVSDLRAVAPLSGVAIARLALSGEKVKLGFDAVTIKVGNEQRSLISRQTGLDKYGLPYSSAFAIDPVLTAHTSIQQFFEAKETRK